jgi:N-acylglucosamine-6-phosphate 2-epimerase
VKVPVIAQGRIWTPQQAQDALQRGAYCVVAGSAITRPQMITRRFVDAIAGRRT